MYPLPVHYQGVDANSATANENQQQGYYYEANSNGYTQWKMMISYVVDHMERHLSGFSSTPSFAVRHNIEPVVASVPIREEEVLAQPEQLEEAALVKQQPNQSGLDVLVEAASAEVARSTSPLHVVGQTGRGITISPIGDRCQQHPSCMSVSQEMRAAIHGHVVSLPYERIVKYVTGSIIPSKYQGRKSVASNADNAGGKLYARNFTNEYHLRWDNIDTIVCRAFFVSTIGITQWTIRNWLGENPQYKGKENRVQKLNKKPKEAKMMQKNIKKVAKRGINLQRELINPEPEQPEEEALVVVKTKKHWLERFMATPGTSRST